MRNSWIKSKGEQLDLLDAIATASTDPNPLAEPRADAIEVRAPTLSTSCDTLAIDGAAGQAR
jgi:hypothetical protein